MVGCIHDDGGKPVKIAITFGLVALAFCCAMLVVVGERVAPRIEAGLGIRESVPPAFGVSYDDERSGFAGSKLPVNEAARSEVKKQVPIDCQSCDVLTVSQLSKMPPSSQGQVRLTAIPTEPKPCISLFVGTDTQSQALLGQWNVDGRLQSVRKQVNFNAYTRDNTLYRERYSQVVPSDQFPAIIVTDGNGGHVYAAGREALPSTANAMYSAIDNAFQIYRRVQQPANQPPDSIVNSSSSSSSQPKCPDGNCQPQARQPFLNPDRAPIIPIFHDRPKQPMESLIYWIWHPGTAMLAFLCSVAFVVLLAIVFVKVVRR